MKSVHNILNLMINPSEDLQFQFKIFTQQLHNGRFETIFIYKLRVALQILFKRPEEECLPHQQRRRRDEISDSQNMRIELSAVALEPGYVY